MLNDWRHMELRLLSPAHRVSFGSPCAGSMGRHQATVLWLHQAEARCYSRRFALNQKPQSLSSIQAWPTLRDVTPKSLPIGAYVLGAL
jgi:hypothetical protein